MIDILKNFVSLKLDILLSSIKKLIDQQSSAFTYTLLLLVNRQISRKIERPIHNIYIGNNDGFLGSGKLIKALSDVSIFINRKDPSIDQ